MLKPHNSDWRSSSGPPRNHGTVLLPVATGEPELCVSPGACLGSPSFPPLSSCTLPPCPHPEPAWWVGHGWPRMGKVGRRSQHFFCEKSHGPHTHSIHPSVLPSATCLSSGSQGVQRVLTSIPHHTLAPGTQPLHFGD